MRFARERTRDFERRQVFEILAVDATTAKDVHDVVDEGSGVTFPRDRDVTDAGQFGPNSRREIVLPRVVVVVLPVGSTEAREGGDEGQRCPVLSH